MSENIEKAKQYVRELNERTEAYQQYARQNIPPLFQESRQRRRKPPREFKDSSFLYIRSYDGDNGVRPFSNIVFWHSPDIRISPLTDLTAYTQTLEAGKTYNINCVVRNRGDLIVPSAKVEFFLVNPTLGFDTRFAKKLGVVGEWVNSMSTSEVNLRYTVPPDESGHKCLFARVFSFSPLDIPLDDYQLSPPLDRHVAQLNLNFINQGAMFQFDLVHLPNANLALAFTPLSRDEMFALRHPFLADFKIRERVNLNKFMDRAEVKLSGKGTENMDFSIENEILQVKAQDPNGLEYSRQLELTKSVMAALQSISRGTEKASSYRELFQAYRQMNKEMRKSTFQMTIPAVGLQKGEAVGLHLTSKNQDTGLVQGGITLVITGQTNGR